MNSEDWSRVHEAVRSACVALFAENGVDLELVESDVSGPDGLAGVIGFSGEHFRGTAALIATPQLVTKTHPLRTRKPDLDYDAVCDWLGELANQLVGRTKNALIDMGVLIQLATPSVLRGRDLRVHGDNHAAHYRAYFSGAGEGLVLHFHAVASPHLVLLEPQAGDSNGRSEEGDLVLF